MAHITEERKLSRGLETIPPTDVEGRPLRTRKSAMTKTGMLLAARATFERLGFRDTRVADIVKEAGTAHGTFYRYFKSKDDIFRALAMSLREQLLAAQHADALLAMPTGPIQRGERKMIEGMVERAIRSYMAAFQENARMIELWEEVATYDESVRRSRLEVRDQLCQNSARFITYLASRGFISRDVDAHYTAQLVGAMTDRFAYSWYVFGLPYAPETAMRQLVLGQLRLMCWPRAALKP